MDDAPLHDFADRWLRLALHDPQNLSDLVSLAAPEDAAALDFSRAHYLDRGGQRPNLTEREADILCLVPRLDESSGLLCYVLIEHQSGSDRSMPLRILEYATNAWRLAWDQNRDRGALLSGVLPIVFYSGQEAWRSPPQIKDLIDGGPFQSYCPSWSIRYLCLDRFSPDDLAGDPRPFANALSIVRAERIDDLARLEDIQSRAVASLSALSPHRRDRFMKLMQFVVMWVTVRLPRRARQRILETSYAQIRYDDREEFMTMTRKLGLSYEEELAEAHRKALTAREEGVSLGVAQGVTQGKTEGLRDLLLKQLEARFGRVSEALRQRIEVCAEDALLQTAGIRVLTAESEEQLGI